MSMIDRIFSYKKKKILSIYFTAGYPAIESTENIIKILQKYSVDIIEIGIPYSDPLADGSIIQYSSKKSLINGMNLDKLFLQLQCIKKEIYIPIILMGYYNSLLRFKEKPFLMKCKNIGISGLIFPDIPANFYKKKYQYLFKKNGVYFILLITTNTPIERIFRVSNLSEGFLYLVSSTSTTGKQFFWSKKKDDFFTYLKSKMKLNIPKLIGFGISNKESFDWACSHAEGAIIGSAFIKEIDKSSLEKSIQCFLQALKGK